jgi:uncharacterized membrane protein YheB (UPF0754 family)
MTLSPNMQYFKDQQQYIVKRTLDDTKDSIKRVTDATSKEISRYNQTVKDSQEEIIKAIDDIANEYLDSQKEIVKSIETASSPYVEKVSKAFSENINNFIDNIIATSRMMHSTMRTYIETSSKSVQLAKDNSKEWSKIAINVAKTTAGVTG